MADLRVMDPVQVDADLRSRDVEIEALEARLAEVEAELAAIKRQAEDAHEYVLSHIAADLRLERDEARAALKRYGVHDEGCPAEYHPEETCTCGLTKALEG